MSKLSDFHDRSVRIFLKSGEVFEGEVEYFSRDYSMNEYGRYEEALQLEDRLFFSRDIQSVELLEEERLPVSFLRVPDADLRTIAWSGGATTQFLIWPREAEYPDRNFLWRISSATVENEESDFTALPDYYRFIATLKGEMHIAHSGGPEIHLPPYKIHTFDGADATISRGCCTDFNLMLRKGKAFGRLEALSVGLTPELILPEKGILDTLLYVAEGSVVLSAQTGPHRVEFTLKEESLFLIEGENPQPFTLCSAAATPDAPSARLLLARMGET
ncbi:MAG: HutD family protein [Lachnospiraceae bacterium]|nr:HutD family protein [Lachnospiraceae bacterium]